jgi:chromate transporter
VCSALIAIASAVALFKYKRGVMEVIALCALVGLAVKLMPL